MNRKEFFAARGKADYIKKHGLTECAPGEASGAVVSSRKSYHGRRVKYAHVAAKITVHPTDESGDASPIRSRKAEEK